jgi:uncharacterized membrane protein YraQ (UPF0718 family)
LQIARVVGFWAVIAVLLAACLFGSWHWRTNRVRLALVSAGAALSIVAGIWAWSWVTAPALPQYVQYDGQQWYSESTPQRPLAAKCEPESHLQRRSAWPLHRVGHITWVSWDSVGSVSPSGRGYAVYTHLPSEVFVEVRPGCYSAYTAV